MSLAQLLEDGDSPNLSASDVAKAVVKAYKLTDHDAWEAWVDALAQREVAEMVRQRRRTARSIFRQRERRGTLAAAVASGDFSPFDQPFVVAEDGTSKPLGEMRGPDLTFVANRHRRQAKAEVMEAAIFDALARRVGGEKVRDVLSPSAYLELRQRVQKSAA